MRLRSTTGRTPCRSADGWKRLLGGSLVKPHAHCLRSACRSSKALVQRGLPDGYLANNNRGSLQLYLDSASAPEWESASATGLLHGFTTNPLILQRAGQACTLQNLRQLADQAFRLGARELQLQTWGDSSAKMYSVGLDLAALDARIVVKVPITRQGTEAAALLAGQGVSLTMTGLYAAHQAFTAASVGADYAAPYLGRMNDAGKDGVGEILRMQQLVRASGSTMRILVASVRRVEDLVALAAQGCDTFTISPACFDLLFGEPLTCKAAAEFEQCAREMGAYPSVASHGLLPRLS